jgi:hypothetical protein
LLKVVGWRSYSAAGLLMVDVSDDVGEGVSIGAFSSLTHPPGEVEAMDEVKLRLKPAV